MPTSNSTNKKCMQLRTDQTRDEIGGHKTAPAVQQFRIEIAALRITAAPNENVVAGAERQFTFGIAAHGCQTEMDYRNSSKTRTHTHTHKICSS